MWSRCLVFIRRNNGRHKSLLITEFYAENKPDSGESTQIRPLFKIFWNRISLFGPELLVFMLVWLYVGFKLTESLCLCLTNASFPLCLPLDELVFKKSSQLIPFSSMSPADSVLQATGYKRKGGHFITTMEQTWRTSYRYSFLFPFQEKHKQELEDMRKAGHEALSIIVDEYKVGAEILLPLQTQGKLFSCA